jgi:ATP-binding cassette, subfamily C (CFTR/MRP), member 1
VDNDLAFGWLNCTSCLSKPAQSTKQLLTSSVLTSCLGNAILIVIPSPYLIAALPILFAVVWLLQRIYVRTSRQIRRISLEATEPLINHFSESIAGLRTIRAFGWNNHFVSKAQVLLSDYTAPKYMTTIIQNWITNVLQLMVAGLTVTVVGVAVALKAKGGVNAGLVGVALLGLTGMASQVWMFVLNWANFESDLTALTRIREFSQNTPVEKDDGHGDVAPSWPEKGVVEFRNATASWRSELDPVLKDINLHIKAGEKVGVCGRTGSGKSSLVSCLFRLMDNVKGAVSIDDVDISTLKLDTLRSRLGAIPQDAFFQGEDSVRDCLCPSLDGEQAVLISDEKLIDTLHTVKIWNRLSSICGEDKSPLDLKMDDVVDSLSEGEKQLFSLARTLQTTSRVIVLDEATSKYVIWHLLKAH